MNNTYMKIQLKLLKRIVLGNDCEEWSTKMWTWSVKVRHVGNCLSTEEKDPLVTHNCRPNIDVNVMR